MKEIFARLPHICLIYGLAFFALGLAVAQELGRTIDSRFKRALCLLVVFGNVVRHACAAHVVVAPSYNEARVRLQIRDDGVGFTPTHILEGDDQSGWGLVGIRERVQMAGGQCTVKSTPGKGAAVMVVTPLLLPRERDNAIH